MKKYHKWLLIISAILFNEFIADYVVTTQCQWPKLATENHIKTNNNNNNNELRAMILADTHLLGPFRGHWLDKLYREWHMRRAFQAAMSLLQPQIIFVLGDLFDEGDFVDNLEFKKYVQRFKRHFRTPVGIPIISAAGNHDIGFHYKMQHLLTRRFEDNFNNTGVKLYTFSGIHFIVINSMAMENDGCDFCHRARMELHEISAAFKCLQKGENCQQRMNLFPKAAIYSQPILLQHFPTYRESDHECEEHDAIEFERYRENWEVLSKKATDLLGNSLNPRILFSGHSHHYCLSTSRLGVSEYTVASFSWRNKINPSFMLVTLRANEQAVNKCNMLTQTLVLNVYKVTLFIFAFLCAFDFAKLIVKRRKKTK